MFTNRLGERPVCIADVGDGSVAIAIVELSHEVTVHAAVRASLPLEERTPEQTRAAIATLFKETLEKVLKARQEKKEPMPHAVSLVMRAPWTRFRTARADGALEKERAISKDLIAEFATKALAQSSELDRTAIIESGVLHVFLNGYPTARPLGKKAHSIGVVAFESDVDSEMAHVLKTHVGTLLPDRPISLRSGMRTLLMVMHEYVPDLQRFFLIDVGGATTALAVVRKEAVTQYAVLPEGLTTILKRVAPQGIPEETLSLLRMLATDTCSSSACEALQESLAKTEPELVRAFGESLASLAGSRRLPNAAMLAAPVEISPWLQTFFSRIDFAQFTTTTQPFVVETLTPEHFAEYVRWGKGTMPDTGIASAALGVRLLTQST